MVIVLDSCQSPPAPCFLYGLLLSMSNCWQLEASMFQMVTDCKLPCKLCIKPPRLGPSLDGTISTFVTLGGSQGQKLWIFGLQIAAAGVVREAARVYPLMGMTFVPVLIHTIQSILPSERSASYLWPPGSQLVNAMCWASHLANCQQVHKNKHIMSCKKSLQASRPGYCLVD